jgi:hypothetical protein
VPEISGGAPGTGWFGGGGVILNLVCRERVTDPLAGTVMFQLTPAPLSWSVPQPQVFAN